MPPALIGIGLLVIGPIAALVGVWLSLPRLLPPDTPDAYDDRGNINGTHQP